MIYLDYAANSPVEEEVLNVYYETTKKYFANPNSVHKLGLEAKELLDKSTNNIAKNLNVLPEEIIYTSGATESNNLAVKGICERYKAFGKHILVSSLEHNSIIASATTMQEKGFEVDLIPVNKDGIISVDEIKKLLRDDTILIGCSQGVLYLYDMKSNMLTFKINNAHNNNITGILILDQNRLVTCSLDKKIKIWKY